MARRYSGKKGRSASKRPSSKTLPTWVRYKPKEVELLIVKLAKEDKTPSQIGLYLRDTYGIPDVKRLVGKKISDVLHEHNLLAKIPEDLMALIKKAVAIKKHMDMHKVDMVAKRGLQLTESSIRRLVKYYKKIKKLPVDWKYDSKSISLLVE
jgi:small subunit ribosomal protein S15